MGLAEFVIRSHVPINRKKYFSTCCLDVPKSSKFGEGLNSSH